MKSLFSLSVAARGLSWGSVGVFLWGSLAGSLPLLAAAGCLVFLSVALEVFLIRRQWQNG